MEAKIYKSGNYIIVDVVNGTKMRGACSDVRYDREGSKFTLFGLVNYDPVKFDIDDITDADGEAYASADAFETFLDENTGFNSPGAGAEIDPSDLISEDEGNALVEGSDGNLFVSNTGGGSGATKTSELENDGEDGENPFVTSNTDLSEFKNESDDKFVRESQLGLENKPIDWTPAFTGYSTSPTVEYAKYFLLDKMCTVHIHFRNGTSNATSLTVQLPFALASWASPNAHFMIAAVQDSGTYKTGSANILAGSNILTLFTGSYGTFISSGNKGASFTITYPID